MLPNSLFKLLEDMKVGQGLSKLSMQSHGLLWLVFGTGLGATPLMGHLGYRYLESHWSVPVEQVELLGEKGLRKVKTKALLFVGTKETKECGQK